ncbi:carboxymuconolactone decarboxylase family protein [Melghirimyces algeriensis]|uniref:Alkylhydroperoxidase AhpD family core domain-containing protein n=1 Tax=Melghirimyces algeriensis TaxID=910412 RepID=A0A521ACJ5_9BACL|nr:carboxymuconolactone decarboxylase family protein [Melghirimyces algeriensis]SMO32491.1 alkylhydroperoxidase AhpD family core domain-containing protein [Melghirimyces algeriensis]
MTKNPAFEEFKQAFPETSTIFAQLYQSVSSKALDEKTKQLVYLAVLTANRYTPAVRVHIREALEAGATPEEIKESIMLTIPAGGLCPFLSVLPDMLEELDTTEKKGESFTPYERTRESKK